MKVETMCNIPMLTTLELFNTKRYYNHGVNIWRCLSDQWKTALYIFKREDFYRCFQQKQNSRWHKDLHQTEYSGTAVNGEGKVEVSPYMPWEHIRRMWIQLHSFLTLTLDTGEWSASSPSCFTPRERAPQYPLNKIHHTQYYLPCAYFQRGKSLGLHLCWTKHLIKYYMRPSTVLYLESI